MTTAMQTVREQIEDCSRRKELLEQAFGVIYNLDDATLIRIMEAIIEKTA